MHAADRPRQAAIVGVISDTHGLLRPAALEALQGSDAIIHAGDIGRPEILDRLAGIAPLTVVCGNVDRQPWCEPIPEVATLQIGGASLFVLHDVAGLAAAPHATGHNAIIFGHSHKAALRWRDGVLFLNPGSAGPRRFSLPVSVARLRIDAGVIAAELVTLPP